VIPTALHFVVGVAVVGAMLWGAAALARRFGARGERRGPLQDGLRIVARRSISKSSTLVRVSVEDRDILLGSSPKGVELLCDLPKTVVVETSSATPPLPTMAALVANWRRSDATSALRADSAVLLPPTLDASPGGFQGVLRTAMSRRRNSRQARGVAG